MQLFCGASVVLNRNVTLTLIYNFAPVPRSIPTGASHGREIDATVPWWDNPTMILTLDAKRRLTVPAALAPTTPGDAFEARYDSEENEIVFRRIKGGGDWLAVLSECPVSMDDVPRRRKEPAKRRRL